MTDTILVEREGAIATVVLNRPEKLNALTKPMWRRLGAAMTELSADDSLRCVVLRGAGGNFQAGGDVKMFYDMRELAPAERRRLMERFIHEMHPVVMTLRRMPKPVLASVAGAAAGFGMSLMLACDLVLAADDAFFSLAYCLIGTSPDGSSTYSLPRVVGLKRAMELALLGERIDAATAHGYGLVNRVVPAAELEAETAKLAARLAAGPTRAYAHTKALLNRSLQSSYEDQLQAELERFGDCVTTDDFMEGVSAFVEKRDPQFKGA